VYYHLLTYFDIAEKECSHIPVLASSIPSETLFSFSLLHWVTLSFGSDRVFDSCWI